MPRCQRGSSADNLSVIPPTVAIAGPASSTPGGVCSSNFVVDYRIFGGTPPYTVSPSFPNAVVITGGVLAELDSRSDDFAAKLHALLVAAMPHAAKSFHTEGSHQFFDHEGETYRVAANSYEGVTLMLPHED